MQPKGNTPPITIPKRKNRKKYYLLIIWKSKINFTKQVVLQLETYDHTMSNKFLNVLWLNWDQYLPLAST